MIIAYTLIILLIMILPMIMIVILVMLYVRLVSYLYTTYIYIYIGMRIHLFIVSDLCCDPGSRPCTGDSHSGRLGLPGRVPPESGYTLYIYIYIYIYSVCTYIYIYIIVLFQHVVFHLFASRSSR